jgi:hypothetical protein
LLHGPHRLVVRTSRCGRDNPGSTPGEDTLSFGIPILVAAKNVALGRSIIFLQALYQFQKHPQFFMRLDAWDRTKKARWEPWPEPTGPWPGLLFPGENVEVCPGSPIAFARSAQTKCHCKEQIHNFQKFRHRDSNPGRSG